MRVSIKRAGLAPGQRDAVIDLLQRFDLPTRLPKNFPREKIFKALKFDKKFEGGKIRFVVTPRIGAALSHERCHARRYSRSGRCAVAEGV